MSLCYQFCKDILTCKPLFPRCVDGMMSAIAGYCEDSKKPTILAMTNSTLPKAIQSIFDESNEPEAVFTALLPVLGEVLECSRIFLYVRNPDTQFGKVQVCWRRSCDVPDITDREWKKEPASLATDEPLFAAALKTQPSVYVEDVETASPDVVNREFEHSSFGHRALIHAHLCAYNQLWGILQPCIFGHPRIWSASDRDIVSQVEKQLTPLVVNYIKERSKMGINSNS